MNYGSGVGALTVSYYNGQKDRLQAEHPLGRLVVEKRINGGNPLLAIVEKNPDGVSDVLVVPFDKVKGTIARKRKDEEAEEE